MSGLPPIGGVRGAPLPPTRPPGLDADGSVLPLRGGAPLPVPRPGTFGLDAELSVPPSKAPLPPPPPPRAGGFGLDAELTGPGAAKPSGYDVGAEVSAADLRARGSDAHVPGMRPVPAGGLDQNTLRPLPLPPAAQPPAQAQLASGQSAPRVSPWQLDRAADVMTRRPGMASAGEWRACGRDSMRGKEGEGDGECGGVACKDSMRGKKGLPARERRVTCEGRKGCLRGKEGLPARDGRVTCFACTNHVAAWTSTWLP
eukprot:360045-Chlamydomonas_euryale.AAC.10